MTRQAVGKLLMVKDISEQAGAPNPIKTVPDMVEVHVISVGQYIQAIYNGEVIAYKRNRGLYDTIDWDTVKKIMADFDPYSINQITVSLLTVKDEQGRKLFKSLRIADGENRSTAMVNLLAKQEITPASLNHSLSLNIIPENHHQKGYVKTNANKKHTAREKLTNPDLSIGDLIINRIFPLSKHMEGKSDEEIVKIFPAKMFGPLSYLVYACQHLELEKWSFTNVYLCRKYTAKISGDEAGTIACSPDHQQEVANALDYYLDFVEELNSLSVQGRRRVKVNGLTGSVPLCTAILADYTKKGKKRFITMDPQLLAGRAFESQSAILRTIPALTTGSKSTSLDGFEEFVKKFK